MLPVLSLTLATLLSSPSFAAQNPPQLDTSNGLVASAQKDIDFLDKNAVNCTRFDSLLRKEMISPLAADLQNYRLRLARYTNAEPQSCASRTDLDSIIATISDKLEKATTPQEALFGMTGDEAMTKALSADSNYPNCRPLEPADPKSTPELRAYFAFKLKMATLRASVTALKDQTPCGQQK